MTDSRLQQRRIYGWALAAACLVAFLSFAIPMYVIRPFRAQGHRELAVALTLRQAGPSIAILCAVLSVLMAYALWRLSGRQFPPTFAIVGFLVTIGFTVLNRVNVYELMFHPVDAPAFIKAGSAKVDPDDMVLAVRINGASRAYPIRTMGYHHIVNDRVGGVAIVATY